MLPAIEFTVSLIALAAVLWFRPWRMLRGALLTPALAALAALSPWVWIGLAPASMALLIGAGLRPGCRPTCLFTRWVGLSWARSW
jgi:hypothetical protein